MDEQRYREVIDANIALHTRMADEYRTCEPHFRPENRAKVKARLAALVAETKARRLLDLGCGTGFMIDLARDLVGEIHGVDVTPAMLEKVDRSGPAKVEVFLEDAGSFPAKEGAYDLVTAYSFLHHLYDVTPVCRTAFRALRAGGRFYADLEPNFYFWEAIGRLDRNGAHDGMVRREIEMTTHKDEDIERQFGVDRAVVRDAEYGKSAGGGFREEWVREVLTGIGFRRVEVFHHWFLGEAVLINDESFGSAEARFRHAEVMDGLLRRAMPLSRPLFKYLGVVAEK
jgi:ubiquinone/menaquinone biosynthesis C-methylase UbiE